MLKDVIHNTECLCGWNKFIVILRNNEYVVRCSDCGHILFTVSAYAVKDGSKDE